MIHNYLTHLGGNEITEYQILQFLQLSISKWKFSTQGITTEFIIACCNYLKSV